MKAIWVRETDDHRPPTDERLETFKAWVCSDPKCPEWGAASDVPARCWCGAANPQTITLVARSDVEQREREDRARPR